jgi:polyphenol oxidase
VRVQDFLMTLPPLDPAFHWTAEAWGHALRCKALATVAQHAFTTKQLQLRGGPGPLPVTWTQAVASVGGGLEQLMRVRQVHGAGVRVLKKNETGPRDIDDRPEADAMISNAPGLVLSVEVADCLPVLLADPNTGAVAAVHAGWRGTCVGVARAAVEAMTREFQTSPSDLIAAIGPGIGPCCYTVGSRVLDAFREGGATNDEISRWFLGDGSEAPQLDLWAANHDQLLRAGLRGDHVHLSGLCTQTYHEWFESYRVDGERAGRMAALIATP